MKILLYCPAFQKITKKQINSKPYCSVQTSIIYLGHYLKKLAQCDIVFANETVGFSHYDVAIIVSYPFDRVKKTINKVLPKIRAEKKISWPFFAPTKREKRWHINKISNGEINKILVCSNFHRKLFIKRTPIEFRSPDHFIINQLGVKKDIWQEVKLLNLVRRNWFIYNAIPHRGIEHLYCCWPYIKEKLPEYELHIVGGMSLYDNFEPELAAKEYERYDKVIKEMSDMDSVIVHGSVTALEYYKILIQSRYMLYPCKGGEVGPLCVREAISCGCIPVIPDQQGIKEYAYDFCIPVEGNPKENVYNLKAVTNFRLLYTSVVEELGDLDVDMRKGLPKNEDFWDVKANELIAKLK